MKNEGLVWSQWDGNYWQIYQEMLSTGLVTQINDDDYESQNPRITAAGQIVWMKWNGSDFEIYSFK